MRVLLFGVLAAVGLGVLLVTTSGKAQPRRARRVLAVGDSLTAGAYPHILEQLLPQGSEVIAKGFTGAGAQEIYQNTADELASGAYDVVVVLAGVNDLAANRGAAEAIQWLRRMYVEASNAGAYVVAVEVLPWAGYPGGETRITETGTLNRWIYGSMPFMDIVVDTSSMGDSSHRLLEKYNGGGGLHLNRAGNECLARLVAAAIEKE